MEGKSESYGPHPEEEHRLGATSCAGPIDLPDISPTLVRVSTAISSMPGTSARPRCRYQKVYRRVAGSQPVKAIKSFFRHGRVYRRTDFRGLIFGEPAVPAGLPLKRAVTSMLQAVPAVLRQAKVAKQMAIRQ